MKYVLFWAFFYRLDKTNAQIAKFEAFVAYNEATSTPLEISSFRAIYFSDCVFNLTMPKWLDVTNFISRYIEEKLNRGTTFLTIIVNRTKRNASFTKIHVLDISLGLTLPELKVRNSRTFHFFRRVWVQTISTNYDNFGWENFDNLCTCSNNLHYF